MKTYFTVSEANAMLPSVKSDLEKLQQIKRRFRDKHTELQQLKGAASHSHLPRGTDPCFTLECEMDFLQIEANALIKSFELKHVQLKDIDTGLVDFPALIDGDEVLLCWRQGEERIMHYHSPEDGFAGRRKFTGE
ncbi:DUF2203 domain-containing protein [Paenibacillus xerothermodurans]|uniref:DUF2203 family protein n=1 Tax=Paenibacillus xerothermodurans TaxID=1977292 RepID=A0A2W1NAY9_PAEXE|nr:DUF2203 domain-containing protein [Paenibacillus xerothermodurans]PZE20401.1 DUF2203 family protein [Paenibacillus xerothermodurans]